jgi:pimeloyl-ACP methyl ester carboxylesterase
VIDIPSLGMSSPIPPDTSMPEVASAIAMLMESLNLGACHVFGLHTGGKVAAALAAHWPDKVKSVMIFGKTHSIFANQNDRNRAMKEQSEKPDSVILRTEGKFLDEGSDSPGMSRLYEANFAFDMAAAVARCQAPLLVTEITSQEEDERFGRQGQSLAALASRGHYATLPQIDVTGLDMYAGAGKTAKAISAFIEVHD